MTYKNLELVIEMIRFCKKLSDLHHMFVYIIYYINIKYFSIIISV